jgi:hypothetical protein
MSRSPAYPTPAGPTPENSAELRALLSALSARFGDGLQAVILYGSCLRSGDLTEGLVDLYALVDPTPQAEPRALLRIAGRILPPNVYYLEAMSGDEILRCKYAVLSLAQFERGTSARWFQSYLWGRFAQPVKVVWTQDDRIMTRLDAAFFQAGETLLRRSLPALPPEGRVDDLWQEALALSYGTELRAERQGRSAELVAQGRPFFGAMTQALRPRFGTLLQIDTADDGSLLYRARIPRRTRRLAPLLWWLRRMQGKTLSLARLVKALFTFEGGLDYIAWKLTRHSGQVVEIPDKVRRRPLLHIWGFCWQLYRRGVFR